MTYKICAECGTYTEETELEKWGEYYLCKNCVKIVTEGYGKAKDRIGIATPKSALGKQTNAAYAPDGIEFIDCKTVELKEVLEFIGHETLHYIIHKVISLKVSFDFDNLAHKRPYFGTELANGIFPEVESK